MLMILLILPNVKHSITYLRAILSGNVLRKIQLRRIVYDLRRLVKNQLTLVNFNLGAQQYFGYRPLKGYTRPGQTVDRDRPVDRKYF